MRSIILIMAMALALLIGCEKKTEAPQARRVSVVAVEATRADAPLTVTGVGHVVAKTTVNLQAQVTGQLKALHFAEGELVRQGQLLASIDPAPFEAALNQAKGNLARDWASAAQAGRDFLRYKDLLAKSVVSQDDFEQRRTRWTPAGSRSRPTRRPWTRPASTWTTAPSWPRSRGSRDTSW